MAPHVQITVDCADPDRLARFWTEVPHYLLQPPPPDFATWEEALDSWGVPQEQRNRSAIVDPAGQGPRLFFQGVPEPRRAKNRVHVDINVSDRRTGDPEEEKRQVEAERLSTLGAMQHQRFDEPPSFWIVMSDPEGNEFCLQ